MYEMFILLLISIILLGPILYLVIEREQPFTITDKEWQDIWNETIDKKFGNK